MARSCVDSTVAPACGTAIFGETGVVTRMAKLGLQAV